MNILKPTELYILRVNFTVYELYLNKVVLNNVSVDDSFHLGQKILKEAILT